MLRATIVVKETFQFRVLLVFQVVVFAMAIQVTFEQYVMIVVVVSYGDRFSKFSDDVSANANAAVTAANARDYDVAFRSAASDRGVRSATRAFYVVFDSQEDSCLGVFGNVNQRTLRRIFQIVTRRVVELAICVSFGATTTVCLSIVFTIRYCRQCFAGRFRCNVNLQIEVIFSIVFGFICVRLCR